MEKYMSIAEYCQHRDIARNTFYEMRREWEILEDCFVKIPKKRWPMIDAEKADAIIEQYISAAKQEGGQATKKKYQKGKKPPSKKEVKRVSDRSGLNINTSKKEAERLLKVYQAAIAKLEFEKLQGTLIDKALAIKQATDAFRICRDTLLNLPYRISGELAAETDQRKAEIFLENEIRQVLEELSQCQYIDGKVKKPCQRSKTENR